MLGFDALLGMSLWWILWRIRCALKVMYVMDDIVDVLDMICSVARYSCGKSRSFRRYVRVDRKDTIPAFRSQTAGKFHTVNERPSLWIQIGCISTDR